MMCVPWMLCVKPYMLWKQYDREAKERKIRGDVELVENPYQVFNEVNYLTFRMFFGVGGQQQYVVSF